MSSKRGLSQGASAIITGASSGIGKAFALMLAQKYSAKMLLTARSQDLLEATALEARSAGAEVITLAGDVADPEVRKRTVQTCLDKFGVPDMLVNNAGLARPGRLEQISVDDWRAVFEVNFFGPLDLIYMLLPHYVQQKKGKIVNIASVAGKVAFPGSVCYASTKFALTGMSEGMAAELARHKIEVITVCPGLVRTEFFRKNKNAQDITAMAQEKNLTGWLLRNFISISSEEAAADILKACEKGGSHELVLTKPGVIIERLAGICPPAAHALAQFVPADRAGSNQ